MLLEPFLVLTLIFSHLINYTLSITTAPVQWVGNSLFQSGSEVLIAILTGAGHSSNYTLTYNQTYNPSPQLAFGIKTYKGSPSESTIQLKIIDADIFSLVVSYLVIDTSLRQQFQAYNNVLTNYISEPLSNITSDNGLVRTFQIIKSYSILNNGRSFTLPISRYRTSTFLTTLYIQGSLGSPPSTYYPVEFQTLFNVFNQTHYNLTISVKEKNIITKIDFTLIIIDYDQITTKNNFDVVSILNTVATIGGTINIPGNLLNNLIIGLSYFSANRGECSIYYDWTFDNATNIVTIQPSLDPGPRSQGPLSSMSSWVVYIKAWNCSVHGGTHPFFSRVSQLCQDLCDDYYFGNATSGTCVSCFNGCEKCTGSASNECTQCNSTVDFRGLVNGNECRCLTGYFENFNTDKVCLLCSSKISNCESCVAINAANSVNCTKCLSFYYHISNTSCGLCSSVITGCDTCLNSTYCTNCNGGSGYFLNTSSNQCTNVCPLAGCMTCLNSTYCQTCDNANQYYLNSLSGSPTEGQCLHCGTWLPNCVNCTTTSQCSICDSNISLNLVLDDNGTSSNFGQCISCPINGCHQCFNLTYCTTCDTAGGYYRDENMSSSTYGQCFTCSIANCNQCGSLSFCSICNTGANYFTETNVSDPNFGQCKTCTITNCTTCSTLSYCSTCQTNSFTDTNVANPTYGQCIHCSTLLPGCDTCISFNLCHNCSAGYYQVVDFTQDAYGTCSPCLVPNCITCFAGSFCVLCNQTANYFLNATLCTLCTIPNCITCADLENCQTCDIANNYTLAVSAQTGFNFCEVCDHNLDKFVNLSATSLNQCEQCSLVNCLDCVSLTVCASCNNSVNYFLNSTTNLCQSCSITGCIICQSLTNCTLCDFQAGYQKNSSSGLCTGCSILGCLACSTATSCAVCDTANGYSLTSNLICGQCSVNCDCDGYSLPRLVNGSCSTTCGDGKMRGAEECDDGNTEDFDGCSSTCKIQENWACPTEGQCCQLTTSVGFTPLITEKLYNQNKLNISFLVSPFLPIFESKFSQIFPLPSSITVGNSNSSLTPESLWYNSGVNILEVTFSYSQNQHSLHTLITMKPLIPPAGSFCSPTSLEINITVETTPDNNVPAIYYSTQQYEELSRFQIVSKSIEYTSYAILGVSFISCKVIGTQLFGILQLSYMTLANADQINLFLTPFANLRTMNGFNTLISQNSETSINSQSLLRQNPTEPSSRLLTFLQGYSDSLPDRIAAIGYSSALFIDNCNIMILILLSEFSIAILLYLITKMFEREKKSQMTHRISVFLLKQLFMFLVLLNAFNIGFSAGIHFKYSTGEQPLYLTSTIIALISIIIPFISLFMLIFSNPKDFGQYRSRLKNDIASQYYYGVILIYRLLLGILLAVLNEQQYSTLILTFFSIIIFMFILINTPFNDAYQNYLAGLGAFTVTIIFFVSLYYRSMTSTLLQSERAAIYAPAILQIVLISICVIFSLGVLIYQFYLFVKSCLKRCREAMKAKSIDNNSGSSDIDSLSFTEDKKTNQKEQFYTENSQFALIDDPSNTQIQQNWLEKPKINIEKYKKKEVEFIVPEFVVELENQRIDVKQLPKIQEVEEQTNF